MRLMSASISFAWLRATGDVGAVDEESAEMVSPRMRGQRVMSVSRLEAQVQGCDQLPATRSGTSGSVRTYAKLDERTRGNGLKVSLG